MTWRFPLALRPVPTTERDQVVGRNETQLPLAPHPGAFGVVRKYHTHEGVDLYCPKGTPVGAVEDGEIVAVIPFTGPRADPPSLWWNETEAVLVEGETGVVVYGEIIPVPGRLGYKISQGELVGFVAQVLTKDKGYPMSMLHLELHTHSTRNAYDWIDERPPSLRDPTPFLIAAHLEQSPVTDPKDIKLPTTTKEFVQYLRDIAEQVDRIPDRPLQLREEDVEVGFYYGHPSFPQMPTGIHFEISFASTEFKKT